VVHHHHACSRRGPYGAYAWIAQVFAVASPWPEDAVIGARPHVAVVSKKKEKRKEKKERRKERKK
jgi:hypothetical protein